jgi:hypothetical protein
MDHESPSAPNVADFYGFGGNNIKNVTQFCATNRLGFHTKWFTATRGVRTGTNRAG